MNIPPVSFKSLMCFTIDDNRPKEDLEKIIKTAFAYNSDLSSFRLDEDVYQHGEVIDGTVYNANANLCDELDKIHKNKFLDAPRKVILSVVDVAINPRETRKRYYLTAATTEDENKILTSSFAKSKDFYVAKFRNKQI